MKKIEALLLDVIGIQDYIYSSNKLKSIIGASHIIKRIYQNDIIKDTLKETIGEIPNLNSWKETQTLSIFDKEQKFEVGYIGGGNALFFFNHSEHDSLAKKFVIKWTTRLLKEYPGLTVIPAYLTIDPLQKKLLNEDFQSFLSNLFQELNNNKNSYQPINELLNLGFHLPCPYTNQPSTHFHKGIHSEEASGFYSNEMITKLKASTLANQKLISDLNKELKEKYTFHTNLEKLGQKKNEKNFLAMVHIDGNNIGKLFEASKSLNDLRKLSIKIDRLIQKSFQKIILELSDSHLEENPELKLDKEDGRWILPIRPILMSGDDISFVTEGRLGLSIAQRWLELLKECSIEEELMISYCGGVCIFNTNFPFHKAYTLANEACNTAKAKSKTFEDERERNWIDFHVQYSGYSGELKEVREQFLCIGGNLLARPYQIDGKDENSFQSLIKDSYRMKSKIPTSNLHELKETLSKHKQERDYFLKINASRKSKIPFSEFILNKSYSNKLFPNDADLYNPENKTHLFDIIEMTEFYLDFKGKKK